MVLEKIDKREMGLEKIGKREMGRSIVRFPTILENIRYRTQEGNQGRDPGKGSP